MKNNYYKTLGLFSALCFSALFTPWALAEEQEPRTIKPWNMTLSNAYINGGVDNLQFEFNRRLGKIKVGLYVQGMLSILENPISPFSDRYLQPGGFMPEGKSLQTGLQILFPFLSPESRFDFWVKGRCGLHHSVRTNRPGEYWYYNNGQAEHYRLTERQKKAFNHVEATVGLGLALEVYRGLSIFVEPAFNLQFTTQESRTLQEDFQISGFLVARWGVGFSF